MRGACVDKYVKSVILKSSTFYIMNNHSISFYSRLKLVMVSLIFLNKPRRANFKCWDFVRRVMQIARVAKSKTFINIDEHQKDRPPFGSLIFLLEKGVTNKKWSHVGIALPFGYFIHMSYYWGEKVTITPLKKIWDRYDLVIKTTKTLQ